VDLQLRDVLVERLPATEVAVANLDLASVRRLAGRLDATAIVTSGYLASERLQLQGWTRQGGGELEGWAADLFTRP
jgi:hypothetical protein